MARAFEQAKALRATKHVLRRGLLEMLGRFLVGASSEVDVAQVVHTFWRGVAAGHHRASEALAFCHARMLLPHDLLHEMRA